LRFVGIHRYAGEESVCDDAESDACGNTDLAHEAAGRIEQIEYRILESAAFHANPESAGLIEHESAGQEMRLQLCFGGGSSGGALQDSVWRMACMRERMRSLRACSVAISAAVRLVRSIGRVISCRRVPLDS
jgi:hypothetical protein